MLDFKEIAKRETNEFTALVLMLGEIAAKLTIIIDVLKARSVEKKELTPEDYME